MLSYVLDKFISQPELDTPSSGFTVTKFVVVSGSIALVLFGMGYTLYGLGSVIKPAGEIIDEFHDSDSSDSSDSESE